MSKPNKATFEKRRREREKAQKRQEKREKRARRKEDRKSRLGESTGAPVLESNPIDEVDLLVLEKTKDRPETVTPSVSDLPQDD